METHPATLTLAVDARLMHRPVRRGIGKSLLALYRTLTRTQPSWRVVGLHRHPDEPCPIASMQYQDRPVDIPGDRFDAWQQVRLPYAAWRAGADVLHCPANQAALCHTMPLVLTVHDLMPLDGPAMTARWFHRTLTHASSTHVRITTPSMFTANQLMQRFNIDEDCLTVHPWAADPDMKPVADTQRIAEVRRQLGLGDGPFVLHLGAADPRKNTARVIEAFASVPRRIRESWRLVVVGLDNDLLRKRMLETASQLDAEGDVTCTGFVREPDMPVLFSEASVLAYPSLSEGFGLPVLDAFATRTAVMTSDRTSLPEVGGDAACYVDPTKTPVITDRLANLMKDESLRASLIKRGTARASQFTWEACADRFAEAVRQSAGQTPIRAAS